MAILSPPPDLRNPKTTFHLLRTPVDALRLAPPVCLGAILLELVVPNRLGFLGSLFRRDATLRET